MYEALYQLFTSLATTCLQGLTEGLTDALTSAGSYVSEGMKLVLPSPLRERVSGYSSLNAGLSFAPNEDLHHHLAPDFMAFSPGMGCKAQSSYACTQPPRKAWTAEACACMHLMAPPPGHICVHTMCPAASHMRYLLFPPVRLRLLMLYVHASMRASAVLVPNMVVFHGQASKLQRTISHPCDLM